QLVADRRHLPPVAGERGDERAAVTPMQPLPHRLGPVRGVERRVDRAGPPGPEGGEGLLGHPPEQGAPRGARTDAEAPHRPAHAGAVPTQPSHGAVAGPGPRRVAVERLVRDVQTPPTREALERGPGLGPADPGPVHVTSRAGPPRGGGAARPRPPPAGPGPRR